MKATAHQTRNVSKPIEISDVLLDTVAGGIVPGGGGTGQKEAQQRALEEEWKIRDEHERKARMARQIKSLRDELNKKYLQEKYPVQ
jgi:hypothetical protein